MKSRTGLVAVLALALVSGGCASGGSSGPVVGPDGQPIPESARPRDDSFTQSGTLYLTQAQAAGDDATARERYERALESAQGAIAADSTNPQGYFIAGQAYVGVGDFAAADEAFAIAQDIYPPYAGDIDLQREGAWVVAYNAGIQDVNAGDIEAAAGHFEDANLIFKGRPEAMLNLGATYSQLGEIDASVAAFQEALDLIQSTDMATADSARVEGWDEIEQQAAVYMGQVLTQGERYAEASAAYAAYLERYPGDVQVMSQMAMVTMAAGDTAAAEGMYNDLMARSDVDARGLYDVGVGLFQSGAYAQSATAFSAVLERAPNHRDAMFNMITALYQAEQWDGVMENGPRLVELDPKNPLAYQYVAFSYAQSGDSDTGMEYQSQGQNLDFTVDETQLRPEAGGGATLSGTLGNNTLAEGTAVVIRVHFLGADGSEAGTVDVTVLAPAPEMASIFNAEFNSDLEIIGFYYSVVSAG
jgi:tetratricopeptide (TPR) repeat protein